MGQYFTAVNIDREEYLGFGMLKFVKRLTNQSWTAALAYLLFQGPQDGTVLTSKHFDEYDIDGVDDMKDLSDGVFNAEMYLEEYGTAKTKEDRERAARRFVSIVEANRAISEANEYAGRWAGDRIAIVGDYDDSPHYHGPGTDISEAVLDEMEANDVFEWLDTERPEVRR